MAAEDYIAHVHKSPIFKRDTLTVWKPILDGDLPVLQIDQANGVTASISYRAEDAKAIAEAILAASSQERA